MGPMDPMGSVGAERAQSPEPAALDDAVVQADLERPEHARAVLELTDAFARDPMGLGRPLPGEVREALVPALARHPVARVFLAYRGGEAVGIATCFLGFSSFAARPLLNIHDLVVLPAHRTTGVARQLLRAVEREALRLDCCKITLEVQPGNARARRLYAAAGFGPADPGASLFLSKAVAPRARS
jgi:GNAT superfamily N-acetyltransferase